MDKWKENLRKMVFGRTKADGVCVTCGSKKINPSDFRDEISRREYEISAMCQNCQDSVFDNIDE